jgi:hypothetical protein
MSAEYLENRMSKILLNFTILHIMKYMIIFIFLCYNMSLSAQLDTIKTEKVFFNTLSDEKIDFAFKKSMRCENLDSNKIRIHHFGLHDSIQVLYKDSIIYDDYFIDIYDVISTVTLDNNILGEFLFFYKNQDKWARIPIYKTHPKIVIYARIDVKLHDVRNGNYVFRDDKITILYYAWECNKLQQE